MRETIDIFALFAPDATSAGQCDIAQFKRLLQGLPAQGKSQVQWSVQGHSTSAGKRFIDVRAQAQVTLECQRCLQLFVLPVQVENRLEIVRSPAELEGDDEIERIVGSSKFDVLELIEDELILSLPSIPKHEVCPSGSGVSVSSDASGAGASGADAPGAAEARPSPFAVLEKLKKDRH